MNNQNELTDFIKRAQNLLKEEVKIAHESYYQIVLRKRDKKKYKEYQEKYFKSDKGRYSASKKNATRRGKFKEACMDLEWDEKKLIGRFYKNCPHGYEVDHIIPVSKGGKHRLSNLQYLTKEENQRKSNKLDYK